MLQDVVMLLLKFNADVGIINAEGHTACDLARNAEIRNLIQGKTNLMWYKTVKIFIKNLLQLGKATIQL